MPMTETTAPEPFVGEVTVWPWREVEIRRSRKTGLVVMRLIDRGEERWLSFDPFDFEKFAQAVAGAAEAVTETLTRN